MKLFENQKALLRAIKKQGVVDRAEIQFLYTKTGGTGNSGAGAAHVIRRLVEAGYLWTATPEVPRWEVTIAGITASAEKEKGTTSVATPRTNNMWSGGVYDGAELRPFTGRRGALDAYKIPSMLYPKKKGGR